MLVVYLRLCPWETFLSRRNKQITPPSYSTFSPLISIIKIHHASSQTEQQQRSRLSSLDVTDLKVKPQFCWEHWNANIVKHRYYFPFFKFKRKICILKIIRVDSKLRKLRSQHALCHVACFGWVFLKPVLQFVSNLAIL